MRVLITGARGFLGQNLHVRLRERRDVEIVWFTRDQDVDQLPGLLDGVTFVFHLAGVNRTLNPKDFLNGNIQLTSDLCQAVLSTARFTGKQIPILYASSAQAAQENPYGLSKRRAEEILFATGLDPLVPVYIFRLPNVFGKWCRPNYNSVVATFCYNVARGLPIEIHDPDAPLTLAYIDNVIERFIQLMDGQLSLADPDGFQVIEPQYRISIGSLAQNIQTFRNNRASQLIDRVGAGLQRALYATYVSYLPVEQFTYDVPQHRDQRGVFVEILKTPDCGQFSFFTANPNVTRGGHYHNSKTEKFLVIKGRAKFRFRNLQTGQTHELNTSGDKPQIVETVPGWAHDITNIGSNEMLVLLWANEVYDADRPDTYACQL